MTNPLSTLVNLEGTNCQVPSTVAELVPLKTSSVHSLRCDNKPSVVWVSPCQSTTRGFFNFSENQGLFPCTAKRNVQLTMTPAGHQLCLGPAAETMTTSNVTSSSKLVAGLFQALGPQQKKNCGDLECGQGYASVAFPRRGERQSLNLRTRSPAKTCAVINSFHSSSASAPNATEISSSSNELLHHHSPLVKMCGITTPEDALLAAQAGAWYVGMIMWPHSKRSVRDWSLAKEICSAAREFGAEPVGVFVSENASEIERACDAAGLSFAQLHGDGARASLLELPKSLKTIYVMQSDAQGCLQTTISPEQERIIDWVLVDGLEGGSGSTFAWNNFKVPSLCTNKGWLLAGGLSPENVGRAISTLRPDAVDVASGIAGADGIRKDPSRVFAFMEAVRASSGTACVGV